MLNSRTLRELQHDLEHRTTTFRSLAVKYGIHEVTIRRYNVRFGLQRKPIDFKGLEFDLKNTTLTREHLAEKYCIDVKTVYNVKKRLGLVIPKNADFPAII